MTYKKVCKICKKEFESDSTSKKYCSEKCAKQGAKRSYRSRKMKHIRSVNYPTDKLISKMINKAHVLAREVAELFRAKMCTCLDEDHVCEGALEVHHINHNVFDNDPSNLRWLCKKAHAKIHSQEEDCNVPDELKAFLKIKELEEGKTLSECAELIATNEEYMKCIDILFNMMDIRCRNSKRQRDEQLNQLSDEDYEATTGSKREIKPPTLTLI